MKNFDEEKAWFKFYKFFPKILVLLEIVALVVILFNVSHYNFSDCLLIICINLIVIALTYIFIKITFSPIILKTEYLEEIMKNTSTTIAKPSIASTKIVNSSEEEIIKELTILKKLYNQSIISKETYEQRKKELLESDTPSETTNN